MQIFKLFTNIERIIYMNDERIYQTRLSTVHHKTYNESKIIMQACNRVWSDGIQGGGFLFSFTSESPNFSKVRTYNNVSLSTLQYTPPLRISFWTWADMRAKVMHAFPDVRDLQTSRNSCYLRALLFTDHVTKRNRGSGDGMYFIRLIPSYIRSSD